MIAKALALVCALLCAAAATADERCRIAFDIGSSGIRAGASNSSATAHADIDYLAALWQGGGIEDTLPPTISALRRLPADAGFDRGCVAVGVGFSAWRLALQQDRSRLAAALGRIRSESGIGVLVVPQRVEGRYGYLGARRMLGDRLATTHVLDIGGGSLQIAGERTSFGAMLGQKLWHRQLCARLNRSTDMPCTLQPLTVDELAAARTLLGESLSEVRVELPQQVTMTAISRPVTRGVLPAIERLEGEPARGRLTIGTLSAAIERIAGLTLEETAGLLGSPAKYASYLVSDMLLVEGLLQATGGQALDVAEIESTNLPGLLADNHAFAWSEHYGCYLERLIEAGLAAYATDAATCPVATRP